MRHNAVENIDSEVVGRIAGASLRHEHQVPGTIVSRSRVCCRRQGNKTNDCRRAKRKLFHINSPKGVVGILRFAGAAKPDIVCIYDVGVMAEAERDGRAPGRSPARFGGMKRRVPF